MAGHSCIDPLWNFISCSEASDAHHFTAKLLACAEQQFELLVLIAAWADSLLLDMVED